MPGYPEEFIDKHKGKHAIIIGSGPSVKGCKSQSLSLASSCKTSFFLSI